MSPMRHNPLSEHYRKSHVAERLLLTGHSHQAWPDCALEGQLEACEDAFLHLDDKWAKAFARADSVSKGYQRLLEDDDGHIALAASTHDLLVRFLSACDLRTRPKIITSDSEFHSMRRQLDRLAETGLCEIVKIPTYPIKEFPEKVIAAIDDTTCAVMISAVFFNNGQICPYLDEILQACDRWGAYLLVDVYHALGVVPFSLKTQKLHNAFIVGGGYKYCQLGEGNAFLRFPADCHMRPIITGWFAQWDKLSSDATQGPVYYTQGGARFEGSTYEPTSHYRAARVFRFFEEQDLSIERLRHISQDQMAILLNRFDAFAVDPRLLSRDTSISLAEHAGFLALQSPHAKELYCLLKEEGLFTDYRGTVLRLGPAPYLSDAQLHQAMDILGKVALSLPSGLH